MGKEFVEVEERDFTPREQQVLVAGLGICAVCAAACYLGSVWGLLGLVPVAVIVWVLRP